MKNSSLTGSSKEIAGLLKKKRTKEYDDTKSSNPVLAISRMEN